MKLCQAENLPAEILSKFAGKDGRLTVAIAGPPGAGKSTISEYLRDAINQGEAGPAVIVPMDGFHLDNAILDERGLRSRKGSPPTFDCAGFAALLERLKNTSEDVVIPVFDRKLDLARAGASVVAADHRILLVEGNYLLLDCEPWTRLAPFFDMTIFLNVSFLELERRLIQRWIDHGHTPDAARKRALCNDIPNAELVISSSRKANYIVTTI
ncbi:nucleoside/nucleotide kinase family protein [Brucella gallinifaecis]|uniref:Nucleoside/nucleotide kinase family protein n=1 Tax=Brucella gallinifaecis TaxID=215590 RepID=A0A502BNK8_9HYPH|nr:nucleoside/nucleotide kinase family protein [Brucella gallinifaecis]TPF75397.1 nucleoside/nucleotide kinase family protein [Brucella gallinifaecis]